MTEEEKKKQGQQATVATQQSDAVEQSIKNLEDRAKKNREFAQSPVKIDTSGQTDWMAELERVRNEYMESPDQKAAREQRERRNRRIAAISDGLVAMSNIAGAMAGATPIKPGTSMSAAHAKAVEDAAKRRRENADRYAIYSRYLSGLQQKQDKENADRYDKAVKARQDADKQADSLTGTVARLRQTRENAQQTHELAKQRADEQKRHNQVTEGQGTRRISIAQQNANKKGKGSGSDNDESKAYEYWESLTPEQKKEFRDRNNRGRKVRIGTEGKGKLAKPVYGTQYMADDKNFILNVYRQHEGWKSNQGVGGSGGGKDLTRNGRNNKKKSAI